MLRNGVRGHKQVELELKLEHRTHTPNADIDYYGKSERSEDWREGETRYGTQCQVAQGR